MPTSCGDLQKMGQKINGIIFGERINENGNGLLRFLPQSKW
jgi:hypothetical protein